MQRETAEALLLAVAEILDETKVPYHLEGGTLLGIVREGRLLPWDKDMDISVPAEFIGQAQSALSVLTESGWRLRAREFDVPCEVELAGTRLLKIKDRTGFTFFSGLAYLDVFAKQSSGAYTYWQAAGRIMRVSRHHYDGYEEVSFLGRQLKVPVDYEGYLTSKYGDWRVPVEDWDCARDERTVVGAPS
jgi:hypothetical protein